MGNRALVIPAGETFGVYLHWNGGYESVYPFLEYCKLKGYRNFGGKGSDGYGIARFCQVVGNFFGGGLSIGVHSMHIGSERWQDNGAYIVDGWDIVEHISGNDYEFVDTIDDKRLKEMLIAIDEAQPKSEQLGDYINAEEIPVSEIEIGDKVYVMTYGDKPELHTIMGIKEDDSPVNGSSMKGVPYVDLYDHDGDYSWNPNNYIRTETVRIHR